jgi:SEC-C motif/Putative zinc- or iron-chelating domain
MAAADAGDPGGSAGLDRLAGALVDAHRARRRLPVVSAGDAAALMGALHGELDRGIAMRDQVAARQGETIACERGCAACCHNVVVARAGDTVAIAAWLAAPERAEVRAGFVAGYARWRRELGPRLDEIRAATARGVRGELDAIVRRTPALCAFNQDGACTIYPVRPAICRTHHALDTAERCAIDVDETPHQLAWKPLDDLVERQAEVERALEEAVRPGGAREPLCYAVHQRLSAGAGAGAAQVGRNDPCPCGSGAKSKRCCGA